MKLLSLKFFLFPIWYAKTCTYRVCILEKSPVAKKLVCSYLATLSHVSPYPAIPAKWAQAFFARAFASHFQALILIRLRLCEIKRGTLWLVSYALSLSLSLSLSLFLSLSLAPLHFSVCQECKKRQYLTPRSKWPTYDDNTRTRPSCAYDYAVTWDRGGKLFVKDSLKRCDISNI